MKVGIVCPYSLSWPGGVQNHVMSLTAHLRESGIDTRLIAPCDAQPPLTEVISVGSSVAVPANGSIARLALRPSSVLRLARILADEDFDLLHLHEPFQAGPTILSLLMAHRTPILATFHAAADELKQYEVLRPVLVPLASRLTERAAVSEAAAQLAAKYFGGEYVLLPNGVEVARFARAEPWPRPDERFVALFVGRLEPRKGCGVLLDAWSEVRSRVDDAHLWIVGSGPEREVLERKAADLDLGGVEFLGALGGPELASRFAAADVFCSPAIAGESFGIVLLEAMAAGTPVVASALDGYASVASGGAALLTRIGDPNELASAIRDIANDDALAARLSLAGRERASEYSWNSLIGKVVETYEEVIGRGSARRRTQREVA